MNTFSSYQSIIQGELNQILPPIPSMIKLQRKGEMTATTIPLEYFEYLFKVKYRPTLTFDSQRSFKEVVDHCPYILRYPWIATENYALTKCYKTVLDNAYQSPVYIKWIDNTLQYGLFSEVDIEEGGYIGEYTGAVRRVFRRNREINGYCFQYPTKWWSYHYFIIDASNEGNLTRFINHSDQPNLRPVCLVENQLLHQVFIANKNISRDTELTFKYTP